MGFQNLVLLLFILPYGVTRKQDPRDLGKAIKTDNKWSHHAIPDQATETLKESPNTTADQMLLHNGVVSKSVKTGAPRWLSH